jgi:hypothetical protein
MMSSINIYIREVEIFHDPLAFRTRLENHFSEICQRQDCVFSYANVYHIFEAGSASPFGADLLIYLLPTASKSLITAVYKVKVGSEWAGATYSGGRFGTISVIYLDHAANQTGSNAADMAFHEMMHNKLRMGDELHSKSNGLGKGALGNQSYFGNYLTADDINLMAPAMADNVPQDSRW